jgi:hypothetical protein
MGVKFFSRADCCMDSICVEMTIGTPPPIPPAGPPAPHAPLLQPKAHTSFVCRSCACCILRPRVLHGALTPLPLDNYVQCVDFGFAH